MANTVNANAYYAEYFGHPPSQLERVIAAHRARGKRLIWTAGDSSLDNKYWCVMRC